MFYDTTKNWNSDKTRIAQKGIIYVYSDYVKASDGVGGTVDVPGFKVGDGTSYLVDMPFAQGEINEEIRSHIANQKIHVSEEDRERWDAAKSAADNATSTANAAKNTADSAKNASDAASTAAGQAKATADAAKSTADAAKSTADAAKSTAETNANDLTNYITSNNSTLEVMQSLIDGSIMTWFFPRPPADDNEPTSKWTTTDLKNQHLGDLYYDTDTGYCYRYQVEHQVYSWQRITDVDVTKALADAKNAQDTADGKRRVFIVQPTPPYDVGDLWAAGANGDIKRCRIAKTSEQSYAASDWELASKYTDDTTANAAKSTAENANSKIDNLKVGGRNLLVGGSGLEQTFSYPSSGVVDPVGVKWWDVPLPPETDFMLSFEAKASDDGNIMISHFWNPSNITREESSQGYVNHGGDGYTETTLTTEWKRYWIHYTGPIAASRNVVALRLNAEKGTGTVSIRKIKLELGNKATDWTPAPEDVDAAIEQLSTRIDELSKRITDLAKEVKGGN